MAIVKTVLRHVDKKTSEKTGILPVTHLNSLVTDTGKISVFGKGVAAVENTQITGLSLYGMSGTAYKFWTAAGLGLAPKETEHEHTFDNVTGLVSLLQQYADLVDNNTVIDGTQLPATVKGTMTFMGTISLIDSVSDLDPIFSNPEFSIGRFYIHNTSDIVIKESTVDAINSNIIIYGKESNGDLHINKGAWIVCVDETETEKSFAVLTNKVTAATATMYGVVQTKDVSDHGLGWRGDLIVDSSKVVTEDLVKKLTRDISTNPITTISSNTLPGLSEAPFLLGIFNITLDQDGHTPLPSKNGEPLFRPKQQADDYPYVIPLKYPVGTNLDFLRYSIPYEIIQHKHKPDGDFYIRSVEYATGGDRFWDNLYNDTSVGAMLWGEKAQTIYMFPYKTKNTLIEVGYNDDDTGVSAKSYIEFRKHVDISAAATMSVLVTQEEDDTLQHVRLYRFRPTAFYGDSYGNVRIIGTDLSSSMVTTFSPTITDRGPTDGWYKTSTDKLIKGHSMPHRINVKGEGTNLSDVVILEHAYEYTLTPAYTYLDFE